MLINEVILPENYYSEMLVAVQDLLSQAMARGIKEINTDKFKHQLSRNGFKVTTSELIQAVDQSGFASSVDSNSIVPASEMPSDQPMAGDEEPTVDVGDLAGSQAMKDVKSGI